MRKEEFENRPSDVHGEPDGYLRRSDIKDLLKVFLAGLTSVGVVFAAVEYVDRVRVYADSLVLNERHERINEDTKLQGEVSQCCWKHR